MNVKKYALVLVLAWLCGLGLFLRAHGLSRYYYSPDDVFQLWMSEQPTLALAWKLGSHEPHPPFLYFALNLMLRVSRNELFLRGLSLFPGLGLIPVFFLLGRKISGSVSGLAMAFMSTFGCGALLMSESIRAYGIMVLCLSLSLYFIYCYFEDRRAAWLYPASALLVVALGFEYVSMFFIGGMGLGWLGGLAWRRRPVKDYAVMSAFFFPTAALLALLLYIHLAGVFSSTRFANPVESWNAAYFFQDFRGLLNNLKDLMGYFFLAENAGWASVLALFGIFALWKQKREELAAMIVLTLAMNAVMTYLHKYSLGGVRHSYYLFPLAALSIGAALQYAYDAGENALRSWEDGEVYAGLAQRGKLLTGIGLGVFLVVTMAITLSYGRSDYLRRYSDKSTMELPMLRADYQEAWDYLAKNAGPGAPVLASYQTIIYILYDTNQEPQVINGGLKKVKYMGHDFYFIQEPGWDWNIRSSRQIDDALSRLSPLLKPEAESRLWIVNIGWATQIQILDHDPFWRRLVDQKLTNKGAGVYSLRASELASALSARRRPSPIP